jgi:BirA family biotin operon repressor/biotin-[acetyl-CoA-carboxylase] ligase
MVGSRVEEIPISQQVFLRFTVLGAIAVCTALEAYGLSPEIKWPNDVLLGRRKVCGALTEASWQGDQLLALVLGVGVNVSPRSVPPQDQVLYPATCVEAELERSINRWVLLKEILVSLLEWLPGLPTAGFLHAWESRLAFRNQWVQVRSGGIPVEENRSLNHTFKEGQVLGLEADGALRLCDRFGQVFTIHYGEPGIGSRVID